MALQQLSASQANPEAIINENFDSLFAAAIFSKRPAATTGLTWGYYGGLYNGNTISDGTVTLTNASDNYVVVLRSTGVVSTSTTSTNSTDPLYAKLYKVTCAGGVVTAVVDQRFDANGLFFSGGLSQGTGLDADAAGFRGIPQNAQTGNYTLVATDAGKHIYHASGAGSGDTYTIPANASVSFEIGTAVTFVNLDSNAVSIAITSDTLYFAGTGTTGTRSLAQYGVATAIKLTSTVWIISGTGLS